jgi:hypothetical protein
MAFERLSYTNFHSRVLLSLMSNELRQVVTQVDAHSQEVRNHDNAAPPSANGLADGGRKVRAGHLQKRSTNVIETAGLLYLAGEFPNPRVSVLHSASVGEENYRGVCLRIGHGGKSKVEEFRVRSDLIPTPMRRRRKAANNFLTRPERSRWNRGTAATTTA